MTNNNKDRDIRLSELLSLYITGTISAEELSELDGLTGSREETGRIASAIMNEDGPRMPEDVINELHRTTWNAISGRLWRKRRRNRRLALWAGSAAAVIALAIVLSPLRDVGSGAHADAPQSVKLVLASGEELDLTGIAGGDTFADIVVDRDSKTLIVQEGSDEAADINYHTLIVPPRNIYSMTLSDGSRVTLNADSRLVFPQRFGSGSRVVYVEGEVFFSVTEDKERPFIVKRGDFATTVLGTEFSVKSGNDGSYITTLVSGSVTVENGAGISQILTPGQQAVMSATDITVNEVDIEYHTGWKDGYFVFRGETLAEVVRRLADWYGLEYSIENKQKGNEKIRARIMRYDDLEKMIDIIDDIRNVIVEDGRIVIR